MFKTILAMAGVTQSEVAARFGTTRQNFNSKIASGTIAILFFVLKMLEARLFVEFPNGKKLDLTQFYDNYKLVRRPDVAARMHCKEG